MVAPLTITLPTGARHTLDLERDVQDACARELLGRVAPLRKALVGELLCYLTLFRPPITGLRWSRALALVEDVLALAETHGEAALKEALVATNDQMIPRAKEAGWKPLRNHRYLTECLEGQRNAAAVAGERAREAVARGETPIGYSQAHVSAHGAEGAEPSGGGKELRELIGQLAALKKLEQANQGVHTETIAKIETRIASLRAAVYVPRRP